MVGFCRGNTIQWEVKIRGGPLNLNFGEGSLCQD